MFIFIELMHTKYKLIDAMDEKKSTEQSKRIGKKILIVDDNRAYASALKCALKQKGFELDIVKDGLEAVERVKNNNEYDAVLTDIVMPRLNGYEATRHMRDLGFEKPIVGISTFNFREDIDAGLEAGMNACVSKTIQADALSKLLTDLF